MTRRRKVLKRAGIAGLLLLCLLLVLPYLLPLSMPSAAIAEAPFDNSAFEQIGGVRFHHRLYPPQGSQAKGKLLLVHGLGGSTFSFQDLAPLIAAQGYLVMSADLPGFGYSGRPLAYDHSQAHRAQDLWQLLDSLDQELPSEAKEMPWHLAGHSMGGGTVLSMNIQEPARTAGLILLAPALSDQQQGRWLLQFAPLKQWLQVALEQFILTERNIQRFLASSYGREPTPDEVTGYLAPLRLPGTARSLARMVDTMRSDDPAALPADTPILVIWGKRDSMVPVSGLEALRALQPGLTALMIEDAAHCPMETHTQQVAEAMLDWLASHSTH